MFQTGDLDNHDQRCSFILPITRTSDHCGGQEPSLHTMMMAPVMMMMMTRITTKVATTDTIIEKNNKDDGGNYGHNTEDMLILSWL